MSYEKLVNIGDDAQTRVQDRLNTVPYRLSTEPDSVQLIQGLGRNGIAAIFGLVDRGDGDDGWMKGSSPDGSPPLPERLVEPGTPPVRDVRLSHMSETIFNLV